MDTPCLSPSRHSNPIRRRRRRRQLEPGSGGGWPPATQAASGFVLLVGRLGERMVRGGHGATNQRPPSGGGSEPKPAAAAARGDESGQWRSAALRHQAHAHGDRGTAAGSSRAASAQNWTILRSISQIS